MIADLLVESLVPPLDCYFVDCQPVWLQETQRCLARLWKRQGSRPATGVRWRRTAALPQDDSLIARDSLVAWGLAARQVPQVLPVIDRLHRHRIVVAAIGDDELDSCRLALTTAGASLVTTDIFGCQRLAAIIDRLVVSRPAVVTDWRTRFVNRLPWMPVTAGQELPGFPQPR
jgi:hypothetical protein